MKNLYRVISIVFLLGCCKTTFAGNILGAEISYKHVAGDSFDVALKVYRDCNGSTTIDPTIDISNSCTTYYKTLTLVSSLDATGIPQDCPQQSKCGSGSFKYGIEERIYKARLLLNTGTCCDYSIAWKKGYLTDSITTGYAGVNFYVYTSINRCLVQNNSCAEFNFSPRFFLKHKQDVIIDLSATDNEYNSLSYELVPFEVIWSGLPPWTYDKPFSFLGFPNKSLNWPAGLHFDSYWGTLGFRPFIKNQTGVYSVLIKEWRKIGGVAKLIGSASRLSVGYVTDDSISVGPSLHSYTNAAGGNGNMYYLQENICNNTSQTYCIEFKFADKDTTDTLYFNYRHNLTDITFTNIGTATKPVIKVCYTPTVAELTSGKPLDFKLEVNDGKCPLPSTSQIVFTYRVTAPLPDSFSINKQRLACRDIKLKFVNSSSLTRSQLQMGWEVKNAKDSLPRYFTADSVIVTLDSGWNKIILGVQDKNYGAANQTHCNRRVYEDSVYIDPALHLEVNAGPDTVLCNTPVLPLNPAVIQGTAPFSYHWEDNSASLSRVFHATQKKDTLVLVVSDANNCTAKDTVFVNYYNPIVSLSGDTANCTNKNISLAAQISGATGPYNFAWTGFPANTATITPALSATTQYVFTLNDGSGCAMKASRKVVAYNPVITPSGPAAVCAGDSVKFITVSSGGLAPYTVNWPTFSLSGDSVGITTDTAGVVNYTVTVTDAYGCSSQNSGSVTVNELPSVTLSRPAKACAGDSVSLAANVTSGLAPYTVSWLPFGLSASAIKVAVPTAGQVDFIVEITDSNGCKTSQTDSVIVNPLPAVTAFTPGIICQSANRVNLLSFGSPTGGAWAGTNVSGNSLITMDTGLVVLNYTFTHPTTGCANNDTTTAYVEQPPVAGFSVDSVKGPVSHLFSFTNASVRAVYNEISWNFGDPASGTNNAANTVNTMHKFSDSGTYTVTLIISGTACSSDTETMTINVYRPFTIGVRDVSGSFAKIYPNPAKQEFTVEGENISAITVNDVQGRTISAQVTKTDALRYGVRLNGVVHGVYFIRVINSEQVSFVYRLIVTD